jgi:hypothetical protein
VEVAPAREGRPVAERLPSLELIADEIKSERDAHIRHADAVDAKAGIVLGLGGAVAALGSRELNVLRSMGVATAILSALTAVAVILPQRFPAWELRELRSYLRAAPEFTTLRIVDTGIVMPQGLKRVLERKVKLLRAAVVVLAGSVALVGVGTMVSP